MTRFCRELTPVCKQPRKPYNISGPLISLIAGFLLLLSVSCEEGATRIGSKMLPPTDYVALNSTDTLSAFSYTMYNPRTRSDNATLSYLGKIYDPYFGVTSAEFVSQIRLGSAWPGGSYTVDSVRLVLTFQDVRGNVEAGHVLRISEISELLHIDSAYYSNKPVLLSGYDLADIILPELKADTVNEIVLDLPVEFGEYLLRDTSKLFHSNSVPDFRSWFRGLYFRMAEAPDPTLLTLRLAPTSTAGYYTNYIALFYHDDDNAQKQYYFLLDAVSGNARYNRFEHDFEAAEPAKKINHINDGIRDTVSFVQSLGGAYTNVLLPGLDIMKEDPSFAGIAINKAVLTIPVLFDDVLYKPSTVPRQLLLSYKTKDSTQYIIPDYNISTTYYGGTIDTVKGIYKFNIASYVQNYLEDKSGNMVPGLIILLPALEKKNVILKTSSAISPVEFDLTFTRF